MSREETFERVENQDVSLSRFDLVKDLQEARASFILAARYACILDYAGKLKASIAAIALYPVVLIVE